MYIYANYDNVSVFLNKTQIQVSGKFIVELRFIWTSCALFVLRPIHKHIYRSFHNKFQYFISLLSRIIYNIFLIQFFKCNFKRRENMAVVHLFFVDSQFTKYMKSELFGFIEFLCRYLSFYK